MVSGQVGEFKSKYLGTEAEFFGLLRSLQALRVLLRAEDVYVNTGYWSIMWREQNTGIVRNISLYHLPILPRTHAWRMARTKSRYLLA